MDSFIDKVLDFFSFDWFMNMFRDNEEFIMTRGLRIMAFGCFIIAVVYLVFAYIQYGRL